MTREDRRTCNQPHTPERRHNTRRQMTTHEFALVLAALILLLVLIYANNISAG